MTCSEKWFNKESDWFLKVMIITVNLCLLFVLSADRDYGGAGKKSVELVMQMQKGQCHNKNDSNRYTLFPSPMHLPSEVKGQNTQKLLAVVCTTVS